MKRAGTLKGAIALDLDGTALDSGGRLRPRTHEAVAKAANVGVATLLTSGDITARCAPIITNSGW